MLNLLWLRMDGAGEGVVQAHRDLQGKRRALVACWNLHQPLSTADVASCSH